MPVSANITSFARVSKVQTIGKDILEKAARIETGKTSSIEIVLTSSSKKRKAASTLPPLESSPLGPSKRQRQEVFQVPAPEIAPIFAALKKRKAVTTTTSDDKENAAPTTRQLLPPAKLPLSSSTPTKANQKRRRSSDAAEAEPADLLERLALSSPARTRNLKRTRVVGTVEQLPQELLDLLGLHTAFLKSLTLHYAHNGPNVPVDIEAICPNVAQSWGKRKVTSEDIQRCVGMSAWRSEKGKTIPAVSPFLLCEYKRSGGAALATSYARGKLCIELTKDAAVSGRLDEQHLNKNFEENLRMLWSTRRDSDIRSFIGTLPKAQVTTRNAAVALLVKGQIAREEMKNDFVKRQQEKEAKAVAAPTLNADGTKMSLLDRIRHKELQQSLAAPAPSPAQLQRRAALQRAEDVAGVIGMLTMATAEGRARISFTMPALLVKLKDSLRVPVSAEDGASCVRLIASEVAPEWLRLVTVGGKENVVIQTAMQPAKTEVQGRVSRLLA